MTFGVAGGSAQSNIVELINETQMRIYNYESKPNIAKKVNIETCLFEIFVRHQFLNEPESYQYAGSENRITLANSLMTWTRLHPEDNQVDEWIRTWNYKHGGLV